MVRSYMVICDTGFLPGYITLITNFIILVLVHFYIIRPIAYDKNGVAGKISKFLTKYTFRISKKKTTTIIPAIIISIVLLIMFLLYPTITSKYCPHKFWQFLGFNI